MRDLRFEPLGRPQDGIEVTPFARLAIAERALQQLRTRPNRREGIAEVVRGAPNDLLYALPLPLALVAELGDLSIGVSRLLPPDDEGADDAACECAEDYGPEAGQHES